MPYVVAVVGLAAYGASAALLRRAVGREMKTVRAVWQAPCRRRHEHRFLPYAAQALGTLWVRYEPQVSLSSAQRQEAREFLAMFGSVFQKYWGGRWWYYGVGLWASAAAAGDGDGMRGAAGGPVGAVHRRGGSGHGAAPVRVDAASGAERSAGGGKRRDGGMRGCGVGARRGRQRPAAGRAELRWRRTVAVPHAVCRSAAAAAAAAVLLLYYFLVPCASVGCGEGGARPSRLHHVVPIAVRPAVGRSIAAADCVHYSDDGDGSNNKDTAAQPEERGSTQRAFRTKHDVGIRRPLAVAPVAVREGSRRCL